jgi:hypothetical protein
MRRLLTISLLVIVPLALLYGVSAMVDKGLRHANMPYSSLNDIYNSRVNADVLALGSSRAVFHISPRILDSVLHKNCYNIGVNGWSFHMQYTIFRICMQHNRKPKYMLQVVDPNLFTDKTVFYKYENFLPYATDTLVDRATSRYQGSFSFPEKYFPLFKYNNHFDLIAKGLKIYFGGVDEPNGAYKGYYAHKGVWDSSFERFGDANPDRYYKERSPEIIHEFETYLKYCKDNDIQLVMIFTPMYYEHLKLINNLDKIKDMFRGYSQQYSFPFLDYSSDTLCLSKEYFFDSQHLNKKGSTIFSYTLANDLKQYIK